MARMLRRGTGTFVLAFARLNVPALRAQLVAIVRDVLAPFAITIYETTLSGRDADIYAELAAAPGQGHPLFVYGLENVMPSTDSYRALGQLNERRGRYQQLGRPVVFWMPEYVLRLIATKAPDFWAWRSGVYEFAADRATVGEMYTREMAIPFHEMTSLTHTEKEARIRLLMALLDDYQGDDATTSAARSDVQYRLGEIYTGLGQYAQAEQLYHQSLATAEALGDRHGAAVIQHALAGLYQLRGDYAQAEELYRQSLAAKEALGDRRGVAITLHNLALLCAEQARFAEAVELLTKSRDLFHQIGLEKDASIVDAALAALAAKL
jgi:tetratricopeptide (TPR) repeat protein